MRKKLLTFLLALAASVGLSWAVPTEFANCYDCWRIPEYPTNSGQCRLYNFGNPYVGNNNPSGPWKLEFVGNYDSSSSEYDSNIVKSYAASEYGKSPEQMEVYRLYQWQNGAYQPVAYGVLYAYANENNQVEHAAFFEAGGHYGCYLTGNTHSSGDDFNITFNEDASTGFADLHGGSTPAPDPEPTPSGDGDKLAGAFSVSGTKVVYFSKGNLQATTNDLGATWTWGFAENQWDYVGNAVANNAINGGGTVSTNGPVDLFAWSSTDNNYFGINNSINEADYSGDFKDWGAKMGSDWNTLTINEWQYLLQERNPGSSSANHTNYPRYTNAQILTDGTAPQKDIKGIILFPDDFNDGGESIDGVTWGSINPDFYSSYPTTCTTAGWATLESMGCVFLPSAGSRQNFGDEFAILDVNQMGNYWSSTLYSGEPEDPQSIVVGDGTLGIGTNPRYFGMSVRLVSETAPAPAPAGLQVTELQIPASWENDQTLVTISDLPGFVAVSLEEAGAWDAVPAGDVVLIYAGTNEGVTATYFHNGAWGDPVPFGGFSRADIFEWASGSKIFYTSGGSTPTPTPHPNGECGAQGDNLLWEFNPSTGTLTITGSGAMADWHDDTQRPWYSYYGQITSVVLPEGLTTIGEKAFKACDIVSINTNNVLPSTLTTIKQEGFCGIDVTNITIPASVVSIEQDAFYLSKTITDVYCYADPNNLTWVDYYCDDFANDHATVCHVKSCHLDTYQTKWGGTTYNSSNSGVNLTFTGDLPGECGGSSEPEEPIVSGYSIALDGEMANADKITLSGASAEAGETVTVTPADGYQISSLTASYGSYAVRIADNQQALSEAEPQMVSFPREFTVDVTPGKNGATFTNITNDGGQIEYVGMNDAKDRMTFRVNGAFSGTASIAYQYTGQHCVYGATWDDELQDWVQDPEPSCSDETNYGTVLISCELVGGVAEASKNEETGVWSFTMPAGNVTITATVEAIPAPAAPKYYIVGSMTGWQVDENYEMALNTDADAEEYMKTLDLTTSNEFKVVKVEGENPWAWYPDGDNYGQNGEIATDGNYTIYFRPEGNKEGWFGGFFYVAQNSSEEPVVSGYTVSLDIAENADKVTLSAASAVEGATVTLTPAEGYQITSFTATSGSGNSAVRFTSDPNESVDDAEPQYVTLPHEFTADVTPGDYGASFMEIEGGEGQIEYVGMNAANDQLTFRVNGTFSGTAAVHYQYKEGGWKISAIRVICAAEGGGSEVPSVKDDVTGAYSFTMPAGNVTITATVEAIPAPAAPKYYVVGNMTGWQVDENYEMTLNESEAVEYQFTLDLTTSSEFKVVKVVGEQQTWYPEGNGNNFGQNGEITADGNYTIYFRPNGNGNEDWFYSVIYAAKNEPKYYIAGSMNEWTVNENYLMTLNSSALTTEYQFTGDMSNGAAFKVVKVEGNRAWVWYPEGEGNDFYVNENGNYTIYFRPNADGGEDWFEGYIYAANNSSEEPENHEVTTNTDPENPNYHYSTFYDSANKYALTNDGTEAFVADLSGTDLVLTKIAGGYDVIPANTAVIFRKNSPTNQPVILAPSDAEPVVVTANNDLRGVDVQREVEGAIEGLTTENCYVLSGTNEYGVGFYRINGTLLKAHKAFVKYVSSSANPAPRRMRFIFEQENTATGVENVQDKVQSTKLIENGVLYIIRDGVRYNAQGQIVK